MVRLTPMVDNTKTCRIQYSGPYLKGQGHTYRLKVVVIKMDFVRTIILVIGEGFSNYLS